MKMEIKYHNPVLLDRSVEDLVTNPDGIYVDVTFGGGGHSRKILKSLSPEGKLFAFDQDQDAVKNTLADPRFELIQANFKDLKRYLKFYGIKEVDGILADFGVSSHQFDAEQRGFSTRFEGRLDMRMDQDASLSAFEVVNTYSEQELISIMKLYGEVKGAHKIVSAILEQRDVADIETTTELIEIIKPLIPERFINKILAQVFQAIRIEVNQELEVIKLFLQQTVEVLKPSGRLVCISYHSLEDRLVKRFIREGVFEGEAEQDFFGNRFTPFKKVGGLVIPSDEEIKLNSRARSAKLRTAEKK
ncbi:MAG: 16S rRNA (cytosine(1402)-N(4))-methyltransferase RsmH [Flavobacteriaceae bacterium]|nr:16S rRNA (cytosine(1402)-N(4))-methyltransferase RsmH [Flavobacteriaceae bacterium]MDO7582482.1 16S rRNA (cytosine(1402)-N(4))-methyltransferase RsmH [Flavobacteriaceae bacterium]MDO7591771.1 16S rRNA (cytosine(1402)-N(4))-methyltransferase RsmH [Flavobacteriaceae bacterium]MDO7599519.1 16S rRNA (cytosine(1402)-N(4))-methyltransferase RsmH [Flavobacteriaceae bacterium]MDO7602718.1 16S rRNA (cytosine(1402)-N(4))-methyltransferase RsmH [Flavobacteriaceae bacterium]